MKAAIVCASVSHGNTRRVADAIGDALAAEVIEPVRADPTELRTYDLLGFGSGIYHRKFHPDLLALVASLPPTQQRRKAFVCATSGFPDSGPFGFSRRLVSLLEHKGYEVLDAFSCRGHDTYGPFKLVGGLHKEHPTTDDLTAARAFAEGLLLRMASSTDNP